MIRVLQTKRRQGETCEKSYTHKNSETLETSQYKNICSKHIKSQYSLTSGNASRTKWAVIENLLGNTLRTWGICCKHLGTTQIEKIQHHSPSSSKGKKLGPLNACSSHWLPRISMTTCVL